MTERLVGQSAQMTERREALVSIGLPVYNGGQLLRAAIDSILAQTFDDFELVISDNASTDTTEQICREYAARDARIRYIRQPTNLGAPGNFAFVLHEARAKYFMWAAHDDERYPEHLATLMAEHARGNYALVASQCIMFDERGLVIPARPMRAEMFEGATDEVFERFMSLHHRAYAKANLIYGVFQRATLLDKPILTEAHLDIGADYVLLLRMIAGGRVRFLETVTWRRCIRGGYAHTPLRRKLLVRIEKIKQVLDYTRTIDRIIRQHWQDPRAAELQRTNWGQIVHIYGQFWLPAFVRRLAERGQSSVSETST